MTLLVRESDVPRVAGLMQKEWIDMVQAEGTVGQAVAVEVGDDEDLPCPACGTAAPLVEGACSDCGLVLA